MLFVPAAFKDFMEIFYEITTCDPRADQLPPNEQMGGHIGAAIVDQVGATKRFLTESFNYICCCAG